MNDEQSQEATEMKKQKTKTKPQKYRYHSKVEMSIRSGPEGRP